MVGFLTSEVRSLKGSLKSSLGNSLAVVVFYSENAAIFMDFPCVNKACI